MDDWRARVDPIEREQLATQIFTEMAKKAAQGSDAITIWSEASATEARLLNFASDNEGYLNSIMLFCKAVPTQEGLQRGLVCGSGDVASIGADAGATEDAETSFSSTDTEHDSFALDDKAVLQEDSKHELPLEPNAENMYECPICQMQYGTLTGLSNHMHKCEENMQWRCDWCECNWHQTHNRAPGPRGKATLCARCGKKYGRHGMTAEKSCRQLVGRETGSRTRVAKKHLHGRVSRERENVHGLFDCPTCDRQGFRGFTKRAGLANHRKHCATTQAWRCAWCNCDRGAHILLGTVNLYRKSNVGPGPDGKGTLCQACSRCEH
jgi:hypothetical protein